MPLPKPNEPRHQQPINPTGFRECDGRWRYPHDISTQGMRQVGRALGTQIFEAQAGPDIVLCHDNRMASPQMARGVAAGLMETGITVHDIGMALSPTAYFARETLGIGPVAMVTASHNPADWVGIKPGLLAPFTHSPAEMAQLSTIAQNRTWRMAPGGSYRTIAGLTDAYLADLTRHPLPHPLRIVVACGNGTAGAFAPDVLTKLGATVIPRHCTLDPRFPHYVPNPEAQDMQDDMARMVRDTGADLALGFDGDGDRCGVVDDQGTVIPADKVGLLLARDLVCDHPGARFLVDIKSTGLFATDPVLAAHSAQVTYSKTGHSHMKRGLAATGALAGFERSGHAFFAPPFGRGYDCALTTAVMICHLIGRAGPLSQLAAALPRSYASPTLHPPCPDRLKYTALARITARLEERAATDGCLGDHRITDITRTDGARVALAGGGFALVRASSNTPNLVVVCESLQSDQDMRHILFDLQHIIEMEPGMHITLTIPPAAKAA